MRKTLPITLAVIFLLLTSCILDPTSKVQGFSSSSTNYNLEGEFGIFGGAKSSTNYKITDTGGGFAIGFGSSANYGTGSGFQYVLAEVPELVFEIQTTSVNLTTLDKDSVKTASHWIKVTTNAREGYQVTVLENGNLCRTAQPCTAENDINDVSGGSVNADGNTEEYGLATSKTGQQITDWDGACDGSNPEKASSVTGTAQTVASADAPVDQDSTTLCYAATISGTTAAGNYQHTLTYIATGTF